MRTRTGWGGVLAGVLAATVQAAPDPRTAGGSLLETADARATGVGGAVTALTGDLGAAAGNPASLPTLNGGQVSAQFQTALGEVNTQFLSVGRGNGRVGWSASVLYLDAGTLDVVPLSGSTTTRRAQQDVAGALSGGVALGDHARFGVSLKALSSTLVEDESAFAWAGDAGLQVDFLERWTFGLSVLNAGGEVKYRNEGDPLPTAYKLGLARRYQWGSEGTAKTAPWYSAVKSTRNDLTLSADASVDRFGGVSGALGLEWDYNHRAVFRAGGLFDEENVGFSAGAGFWLRQWRLDYSFQWVEDLPDRHRFTVSWFWGRPKPTVPAAKPVAKPNVKPAPKPGAPSPRRTIK